MNSGLLTYLALVVLGLLAVVGHLVFWRRKLAAPGQEDQQLTALTRDGWRLCLGRRLPKGAPRVPPVLLLHGVGMNRLALDFGVERHSLSAALAAAGFDCFALDLRGHGGSRRPPGEGLPPSWTLDDYLALDLPAALDAVKAATGQERAFLVGHSQGALLALAAASTWPHRVAGVVALAPPIRFTLQAAQLKVLPFLARWQLARFGARVVAPFSGLWQPPAAGLAIQLAEMDPPIYRRLMMNVLEDLPPGVIRQFEGFIRQDRFGSVDGTVDHRPALATCRQPARYMSSEDRSGSDTPFSSST